MNYEEFFNEVLRVDRSIRFVGVLHNGNVITKLREGLQPYLTAEESEQSIRDSRLRWDSRSMYAGKIGDPHYVITLHDKIMRFTIPIGDEGLLLFSTEPDVYPIIIIKEIIQIKEEFFPESKNHLDPKLLDSQKPVSDIWK